MDQIYEVYSPRVTLREYLWETRNPIILIVALVLKLLRVKLPSSTDDLPLRSLDPLATTWDEWNSEDREKLSRPDRELRGLGFNPIAWHSWNDVYTKTRYLLVTYRHVDGSAWARLQHRIWGVTGKTKTSSGVSFVSSISSGTKLVTTTTKPDMKWPASFDLERHAGMAVPSAWARHKERLTTGGVLNALVRVATTESALADAAAYQEALFKFHLDRGVFIPRPAWWADASSATLGASETDAVISKLAPQQKQQSSWLAGLGILALSAFLFVGLGSTVWTWRIAVMLVPVLLIHELGHFVTMKLLGYQNLRMFFIPLFGAAVTGHATRTAGWKQASVSLMGPLPGIAIGIVAGIAGIVLDHSLLIEFASLSLIVNGFNLLPVLPLDGGWVVHATLTCRHPWLNTIFRGIAVLMLVVAALLLQAKLLLIPAILMAISIPAHFKLSTIAQKLRETLPACGVAPSPSPPTAEPPLLDRIQADAAGTDSAGIQRGVVEAIIEEVRRVFPKGLGVSNLSQYVGIVLQDLQTRPPRALASIGFLGVHLMAVVVAIGAGSLFIAAQDGNLSALFEPAIKQSPRLDYLPGSARTHSGGTETNSNGRVEHAWLTIVGEFTSSEPANTFYDSAINQLKPNESITLVGQTVLIEIRQADSSITDSWQHQLVREHATAWLASPDSPGFVELSFVAPSSEVAERIEHAFDTLAIGGPNERLIPDWDPDRRINPDHYRNRETYHLHTQAGAKAASMLDKSDLPTPSLDPESFRKSFAGYQVKLEAITARARQELREQRNEAGDVALYRILDQEPKSPPVTGNREDQPEWLKWQADYGSWLVLVSKELGTMDMTSGDWAISASHGYVERAGIVVSISTLQLDRPVHGVPHLLRWLEDLGCTNFKYRVTRYDADY